MRQGGLSDRTAAFAVDLLSLYVTATAFEETIYLRQGLTGRPWGSASRRCTGTWSRCRPTSSPTWCPWSVRCCPVAARTGSSSGWTSSSKVWPRRIGNCPESIGVTRVIDPGTPPALWPIPPLSMSPQTGKRSGHRSPRVARAPWRSPDHGALLGLGGAAAAAEPPRDGPRRRVHRHVADPVAAAPDLAGAGPGQRVLRDHRVQHRGGGQLGGGQAGAGRSGPAATAGRLVGTARARCPVRDDCAVPGLPVAA